MEQHSAIEILLEKYMLDTATLLEEMELAELIKEYPDSELCKMLDNIIARNKWEDESYYQHDWEKVIRHILRQPGKRPPRLSIRHKAYFMRPVFRYAAAFILVMAVAAGIWLFRKEEAPELACGLKLPPREGLQGDNIVRMKIINGNVALTVPESWQYYWTLPDGSKVWLNAASVIKYPLRFKEGARRVEIAGEAYFEVKEDARHPFYVNARGVNIQVLGTSFNVSAYADQETVKTTLVSGSLKIINDSGGCLLKPGQQAITAVYGDTAGNIHINLARNNKCTAWKEGYFSFQNEKIPDMMNEFARWYNWKLIYANGRPTETFSGSFCRRTSESEILKVLQRQGVHVKKKGKAIIIMQ